jgi:putative ABC transport system permease protein
MFDLDKWQEIFFTISKNKLRTFLTAFSVSWGIFILMILLGFGTGLQRGVESDFGDDATNSIWVNPGETSIPYRGMKPGRKIRMTNDDVETLAGIEGVEHAASHFYCYGEFTIRYKDKYSSFTVLGITPEYKYIELQEAIAGRYINDIDMRDRRKVAILGTKVVEGLFEEGEDPVGKWLNVRGIRYQVVGVYKDQGNEFEVSRIFIPLSTAQLAYNGTDRVHRMTFTVGNASVRESKAIVEETRQIMSEKYHFDPADERAVFIWNNVENFKRFTDMFMGIRMFLWIVGIGTIVAGIVGVSNIMLIIVKDRTREIGIRKALGATANSIVGLFLQESITITIIAGYTGLILGIGTIELIHWAMIEFAIEAPYFKDPEIHLQTAVYATLMLIIAGALAGYFPAKKAAKVDPIIALHEE